MSESTWTDRYTADEMAVALDHHAAVIAKRSGNYHVANELRDAAECIRDLSKRCTFAALKAEYLAAVPQRGEGRD
jgi:hypothetical protein